MRRRLDRCFAGLAGITLCGLFYLQTLDQEAAASSSKSALHDEEDMAAAERHSTTNETRKQQTRTPNRDIEALFPHGDEANDRVLAQMRLQMPVTGNKTILAYNGEKYSGNTRFVLSECPMRNCYVTTDHKALETADAVLFKGLVPTGTIRIFAKNPNQVRILYMLEAPPHTPSFLRMGSVVNWTATYRRDSVINTPYERFTPFPGSVIPDKPARNYALGKRKLVAWFVSNCNAPNGRSAYVKELQKYISVDVYGSCGKLKCPRYNAKLCFDYLNKDYKFYLAFENSNCKDYITEKFFVNGLG